MSEKIVLIDGHSILNRAFYGIPNLSNSEGIHTNAVYGFLNIMFKILDEEQADYLAVAFDLSAPTFRHQMFDGYKGTRKSMPDELREQVPIIKKVLKAMNILTLEKEGFEADDILGNVSRKGEAQGFDVAIISGDRDLLQLATQKVKIRIPKTKMGKTEVEDYYAADVEAKYQVTPEEFISVKALMGDASDNIPGVPGIGEKTATKIISEYKSLDNAMAHVEEVKPKKASENMMTYKDQAYMSLELAAIKTDFELDFDFAAAKIQDMYNDEAYKLFKWLEFKNILSRFQEDEKIFDEVGNNVKIVNIDQIKDVLRTYKGEKIGFYYIYEESGAVYSLCTGEKDIYVAVEETEKSDNCQSISELINELNAQICVMNIKDQVLTFNIEETASIFDVGIAAYLLNPLKDSYDFDDIARDYLGMTVPGRKDMLAKKTVLELYHENSENFKRYIGYQSYIPVMAAPELKEMLEKEEMYKLYTEIELPVAFGLADMERLGVKVARSELKAYGDSLVARIEQLEHDIHELAGEAFNINSPKQLGVILFEKMNLPFAKKTKTGYSTSADVLEKLRSEDPIIDMILEYRQLTKLKSTYADGLANYIGDDERIHGKFNQTITATGRLSSTEPNLQNIPIKMELGRLIRKVFIPEEGFIFVDADYSQIELRVLAHLSDDETLIRAYHEDQDIHKITASQVFHTPLDEVTPLQRSNAKAVNFGIVYGISSFGLSQDLSITKKEADMYIKQYFHTYPGVKRFLDTAIAQAKEQGSVTTMFKRKRPVPELKSSNFMQRSFGERVAMNSPIQGSAADIIKIAMINVRRRLKDEGLQSRLILQVHDELLIEAHTTETEKVKQILAEEMSQAVSLRVPLEVDIHTGRNWYEAK